MSVSFLKCKLQNANGYHVRTHKYIIILCYALKITPKRWQKKNAFKTTKNEIRKNYCTNSNKKSFLG